MEQKKLQAAIEAILFAMGGSVELKKLAQAIGHDEETTKKIIRPDDGPVVRKKIGESGSSNWKLRFRCARKKRCMNI